MLSSRLHVGVHTYRKVFDGVPQAQSEVAAPLRGRKRARLHCKTRIARLGFPFTMVPGLVGPGRQCHAATGKPKQTFFTDGSRGLQMWFNHRGGQ